MQQRSKSGAIGLAPLLAPVKEDNEVIRYRGPRRAPARWGKEEPPHEVKAYLLDTLTDEELSKSVIWFTTPMQQRSKSGAIG